MAKLRDTKGRFMSVDMNFDKPAKKTKAEAGRMGGLASAKARRARRQQRMSIAAKRRQLRAFNARKASRRIIMRKGARLWK